MKQHKNWAIRGGRVVDPANGVDRVTDLFVVAGRIAALDAPPDGFNGQEIDARGLVVCPGLVDIGPRLREPGHEHKGTIASETAAAVRGGITTLCCSPDTDPVIDSAGLVALIRRRAKAAKAARVLPIGALTGGLAGTHLAEMHGLKEAGCVALSNADRPLVNSLVARRALEYATTFGIRVVLHPNDPYLSEGGCAHEGAVSERLGLPGIPEAAETAALARDLALAEHTGAEIHFHALSSAGAVKLLRRAQQDRLRVSANCAAHQLHLTEMDLDGFNANCHLRPPLRTTHDREALRQAVADGAIAAICSDHQPHDDDAKLVPFQSTAPGLSGLETLLPLVLRLVDEGVLGLSDAIARVTCGPADCLGLGSPLGSGLGRIGVGNPADICLFDPDRTWRLTAEEMASTGRNTPFLGWELKGRVTHTMVKGRMVFHEAPAAP